jgi:hypothetical protein
MSNIIACHEFPAHDRYPLVRFNAEPHAVPGDAKHDDAHRTAFAN